jgi:putative ABC transport system substrate-binding protein
VKRREFITLLGGALVTWPSYAGAERASKVARIGFLVTGTLTSAEQQTTLNAFRQGLRERGYVEGQNIAIEYRAADGRIERFPTWRGSSSVLIPTSSSPAILLQPALPRK